MANIISDETIEYVGILAKLELSDEEKEAAKKDMGRMLDYIDKLNELDTTGVEPSARNRASGLISATSSGVTSVFRRISTSECSTR